MRLVHKFQEFMGSITWNRFLSWGWYNTWYIAVSRDSWLAIFLDLISLPVSIALVINVITTPPWIQLFSLWDRDKIQKFQQWNKIHDYHYHVPRSRFNSSSPALWSNLQVYKSLHLFPHITIELDQHWSLCRCLKLIKIIKFFILSVSSRKKERKRKKEAFHNKLFGEGRVLTKFPTHLKGIICAYTNPLHFPSFSLNRQNAR